MTIQSINASFPYHLDLVVAYSAANLAEIEANASLLAGNYVIALDTSEIYLVRDDASVAPVELRGSTGSGPGPSPSSNDTVTLGTFIASENISSGSVVNLWNNGGIINIRNADAVLAREAFGFVNAAVLATASVEVFSYGKNTSLGGLSFPFVYYLGTAGGVTLTPLDASNLSNTGKIVQRLGASLSATTMSFDIEEPVYL